MNEALGSYLARQLGVESVRVTNLVRIPGGASRETWRFDAEWEQGGREHVEHFIVRKDPPASLLETERELEYAFYTACYGTDVPVPRMRWLERDPSHLGSPFFIMERILDVEAAPRMLVSPAYEGVRHKVGRRMYEIMGALHRLEWRGTAVEGAIDPPTTETAWQREVDHWERVIDENEESPQPVMRAAIRWLRRNPPPPARRVSMVHGDFRVGNVLYDTEGGVHALLDWEMAHLGDPLEDLAWSFLKNWEWAPGNRLKGGVIEAEEAIAIYEEASGWPVDREALHWWDVFSSVKAQGIWITGSKSFAEGRSEDLMHAIVAWSLVNTQDETVLESLGKVAS